MRFRKLRIAWSVVCGLAAIVLVVTFYFVSRGSGPQVDPSKVVTLDDLAPIAMNCLLYRDCDYRGWPYSRRERTYVRFLQDHDCRIAFEPLGDGEYSAVVGVRDSLKIRKLYEDAKKRGVEVPKAPFSSFIE
jgi:hypothetical protein